MAARLKVHRKHSPKLAKLSMGSSLIHRNRWLMIRAARKASRLGKRNAPKPTNQGTRWERMRRVESALFLSREALTTRKLNQLADIADGTETRTLVQLLNQYYDAVGRSFRIEKVAGGYLMMTRPELSKWLRRLVPPTQKLRFSQPAIETLTVVAYRQPVMRAEIDAVRGVNSGEVLRQLMEMDMVKISGRSEELGRPYLYSTTKRFLKYFGLNHLDELPKTKSMDRTVRIVETTPREILATNSEQQDPIAHTIQQEESAVPVDTLLNISTEAEIFESQSRPFDEDEFQFEDPELIEEEEEEEEIEDDEEFDEEYDDDDEIDDEDGEELEDDVEELDEDEEYEYVDEDDEEEEGDGFDEEYETEEYDEEEYDDDEGGEDEEYEYDDEGEDDDDDWEEVGADEDDDDDLDDDDEDVGGWEDDWDHEEDWE